jgi:hypothetical protein
LAPPGPPEILPADRNEGAIVRRRSQDADRFEVNDVAERLAPYNVADAPKVPEPEEAEGDLVEKAVTLLSVMPRNQHRETLEGLLSPNDPERGRRAVDALIDAAFAAEDTSGRLRRIA